MSKEDYLFLFQILSAIAVIISIFHLGYQIRQNTKALRRNASRDIVHDLNDLGRFFIEIPELIEIYFDATEKPEGLTKADRFRFQTLLKYIFSNFDLALAYHGDGLIGDDLGSRLIATRLVHHLMRLSFLLE